MSKVHICFVWEARYPLLTVHNVCGRSLTGEEGSGDKGEESEGIRTGSLIARCVPGQRPKKSRHVQLVMTSQPTDQRHVASSWRSVIRHNTNINLINMARILTTSGRITVEIHGRVIRSLAPTLSCTQLCVYYSQLSCMILTVRETKLTITTNTHEM